jgi:plasmid stabilization system protein ParE
MARRHKKVIWTNQGYSTLDEAVAYVAQDSLTAAQQLLEIALDTAESLSAFDERGRVVPELQQPNVRELLVQRYRLIYEVFDTRVEILAFIHGARDFAKWRQFLSNEAG